MSFSVRCHLNRPWFKMSFHLPQLGGREGKERGGEGKTWRKRDIIYSYIAQNSVNSHTCIELAVTSRPHLLLSNQNIGYLHWPAGQYYTTEVLRVIMGCEQVCLILTPASKYCHCAAEGCHGQLRWDCCLLSAAPSMPASACHDRTPPKVPQKKTKVAPTITMIHNIAFRSYIALIGLFRGLAPS